MENSKKEDLVFVSFDRIWANFKKYWWICIILTAAMFIYGAATYNATLAMSGEKTETDLAEVVIPDDPMQRMYYGSVPVKLSVNVDKYLKDKDMEVDSALILDFKQQLITDIVTEANMLLTYSDFTDPIAEAYSANGYNPLVIHPSTVNDTTYDQFSFVALTDSTYELQYMGIGGIDRITTGIKVGSDTFIKKLADQFDYIEISAISEPTVLFRVNIFGFYRDFAPTEETVQNLKAEYAEHNKIATGEVEKYDFSFNALFKISTIIKGAVGFVAGLFIIFVIAICDKKVRTREEIERFFDGEDSFLGEIRGKAAVTEDITAMSLNAMCEKQGINNLLLTTVGKQKNSDLLMELSAKITNGDVKATFADGIEVAADTTRAIAKADGVVIIVNSGLDDVHTVKSALSRINTVDGKLLGYVLNK